MFIQKHDSYLCNEIQLIERENVAEYICPKCERKTYDF